MKLYSQSYYIDNVSKKKIITAHYILPFFYRRDKSLLILRMHENLRKNYFIFNGSQTLLSVGFKIWNKNHGRLMIQLHIFGDDTYL